MSLYIFLTEDGNVLKSNKITESDKSAVDAGILDILRVEVGYVLRWNGYEWSDLETVPADMYSIPEGES